MSAITIDLILLESVAAIVIVSAVFAIRQEWRDGNRPSFALLDVAVILSSIAIALTFVVASTSDAHYIGSKCADTSEFNKQVNNLDKCRRVARVIHRHWKNNDAAHKAQRVFSCESGLDRWSRYRDSSTQYRMIPSFSRAWRDAYRDRLSWRVGDQMWVAHDIYRRSGWKHWGAGASWGCA